MTKEMAFPVTPEQSANGISPQGGMTLRDYFAAKAMQTLIACVWERTGDTNNIYDVDGHVSLHLRAYEHADAMLKARDA